MASTIIWKISDEGDGLVSLFRERRPVAAHIDPSLAEQMIRRQITPSDRVIRADEDGYETDCTAEFFRDSRKSRRRQKN